MAKETPNLSDSYTPLTDVSYDLDTPVRQALMDPDDSFWRATPNSKQAWASSSSRSNSDQSTPGLNGASSSSAVTIGEHSKYNYLSAADPTVAAILKGKIMMIFLNCFLLVDGTSNKYHW